MAKVMIPDEGRTLEDDLQIREFLNSKGIQFERWEVDSRIGDDASDEDILAAYEPEIERLKTEGGFVTADVIDVCCNTPNLDAMLDKFNKEHTHSENEVRFTIEGSGLFHINPDEGPVFAIHVQRGDLINVPKGTKHWFDLCDDRRIRCIRLFEDRAGWTPHYVEEGSHGNYEPLCWGPNYVPGKSRLADDQDSAVRL